MNARRLLLIAAFALAGCETTKPPQALPAGGQAPVTGAAAAVNQAAAASRALDEAQRKRESAVAASIREAAAQNEDNPPGAPRAAVKSELELADRTLGIEPSESDRLAAAERALAVREGRLEDARRLYAEASVRVEQLVADVTAARAQRDTANAAAAAAIADAQRQIAENTRRNDAMLAGKQRELDDLRSKIEAERRALIIKGLLGLGVAFILAAAGLLIASKGTEFVRGGIALALGFACFGAARAIGHWLFPWVMWGAVVLFVVGGAIAIVVELRERRRRAQAEAEKRVLEETAASLVSAIDEAKTPGSEVVALDLAQVGRRMDRMHKLRIEELRTRAKRAKDAALASTVSP